MSSFSWYGDALKKELEEKAAEILLMAAIELQTAARADLNRQSNPAPHKHPAKPGSFPKVRTGFLRDGVMYWPTSIPAIAKAGFIRIGYSKAAFYGVALGKRGFKWIVDSLNQNRQRIEEKLANIGRIVT